MKRTRETWPWGVRRRCGSAWATARWGTWGALVALGLCCLALPAAAQPRRFDPAQTYRVERGAAPAEGPRDAPVTIVEWSDFACGYCARAQPLLTQLALLYPGQIQVVHRTFPLDSDDTLAAQAALAAHAQGRYAAMRERLFARRGRVDRIDVELIAQQLGLDMVVFRGALDSQVYAAAVRADEEAGRALGVSGTPAFFVNGRPVIGAVPLRSFVELVETEVARALQPAHRGQSYEARVAQGLPAAELVSEPVDVTFDFSQDARYRVGLGLPGHVDGPANALVTIVAWTDFECPFCSRHAPVLRALREHYRDQVRIAVRHFPLPSHRHAVLAAEAAVEAGRQGHFAAFHDALFAYRGELSEAALLSVAAEVGMDVPRLRDALHRHVHREAVLADAASGAALGVDGTPMLFVNGQPISGAKPYEQMQRVIDAHLSAARTAMAHGIAADDIAGLALASAIDEERALPASVPVIAAMRDVVGRALPRLWALAAACRLGDAAMVRAAASEVPGLSLVKVRQACRVHGVDWPATP